MNLPGWAPQKCTVPPLSRLLRDRLSTPELALPVRCHADCERAMPVQPNPSAARGGRGRVARVTLIPMMCPLSGRSRFVCSLSVCLSIRPLILTIPPPRVKSLPVVVLCCVAL